MPGCTSDSRKDHFQRRKVGSIRDNPKLMKIRQQFENASGGSKDLPKADTFCGLLSIDSKSSGKPLDAERFPIRRHSEGETIPLHVGLHSVKSPKSTQGDALKGEQDSKIYTNAEVEKEAMPPLPKRGVSPATQRFLLSPKNKSAFNLRSKKDVVKEANNVQKRIELYEGMSPKKNKLAKSYGSYSKLLKREESFSRRSHKRSFRRSKLLGECPPVRQKDAATLSDSEEGGQNVYQTLSTLPASVDDPYDRLSRIHDVLHQIHEGPTCAACKAIPSIQLRHSAMLEVKCHEASPHHHPPCICFSCQHSVFSCSVEGGVGREDLYYNLCCLGCESSSWRQSRRRPICEQNGRLCVVNCDMEKASCANSPERDYENLSDCQSMSPGQSAKQVSGDSCESDEGWVDVTDSEDEKTFPERSPFSCDVTHAGDQSASLDDITDECSNLKLSPSTEHLYESISELESQESRNPENDPDSGEWSTESGSPVFNESSGQQGCGGERSKNTFMKTVLGRRAPSKKRRMSTFFVPWLVSNSEYCVEGHNKVCPKKATRDAKESRRSAACRNAESLKSRKPSSPDASPSPSSSCSSTYLRADEVQGVPVKRKTSVPCGTFVDVSVERVCRRSSSGNSEHSYILFTPIKEDQVPLYQFYERNVKERVSFCRSGVSPVMWSPESLAASEARSPSQLSVVEQLSPDASSSSDMKMLWCELPEVKESGILERISAQELKLQEATFEFIQSQASYVRSLKVLHQNFIRQLSPSPLLSKHEQDVLFSDISRLQEVGERVLRDVTARWSESILIPDICDILLRHAPSLSVYVKYCSNRVYQERTLKELKESRLCFLESLRKLEGHPACQGLSLESFLFLPMQHIARLPLLLDNLFRWLTPDSPAHPLCRDALEAVHKIFMECNESARKMERLEEMFVLNKQLEFKECKVIPLISASRWLLKRGELLKLEFDKKTFGRSNRCARVPLHLFLFNDLLVITKRKNEDCYTVVDYCAREKVQATAINARDLQQPLISPNICRYLIYMKLMSNHQGAPSDLILNCTLLSERTRWIEAIHSAGQNKPCEIWEYDCPQVQCFKSYVSQQPDELSLQESDVVTVHRKMNDGWYEGRRLRDGLQGWFPASHTVDIPCSRARASNLRQCYRLLMLTSSHH